MKIIIILQFYDAFVGTINSCRQLKNCIVIINGQLRETTKIVGDVKNEFDAIKQKT